MEKDLQKRIQCWLKHFTANIVIGLLLLILIQTGWSDKKSDQKESQRGQTKQTKATVFRSGFNSTLGGDYFIPLDYSTEAVVEGIGSERGERAKWEFVQRHSDQNLWTYIMKPQNMVNPSIGKIEIPKIGWDKFMREYGSELAQIQIMWSPKEYDGVEQDFHNSIKLHKSLGIWIDGSEEEIQIDGNKAMSGRFKAEIGGRKMYATFVIVHIQDRRYQIDYSYTKGFSDPDNSFEKIKQMKFCSPNK